MCMPAHCSELATRPREARGFLRTQAPGDLRRYPVSSTKNSSHPRSNLAPTRRRCRAYHRCPSHWVAAALQEPLSCPHPCTSRIVASRSLTRRSCTTWSFRLGTRIPIQPLSEAGRLHLLVRKEACRTQPPVSTKCERPANPDRANMWHRADTWETLS